VCVSENLRLLLRISPKIPPIAPASLVPLGLAGFALPLCTNVIVTTLIAMRIWYLSPRKLRDTRSSQFPTGTGRTTIEIVVESGMLYLAVQLVFVVLFAIRHPAQGIVGVIAVQIYVRVPFTLKGENCCKNQTPSPTGYRTDTDSRPRGSRLVEYAVWTDFEWSCTIRVAAYASTYWLQHGCIHGC
jgi:hypothetical protein